MSLNSLTELEELDVNDINIDHNEFFQIESSLQKTLQTNNTTHELQSSFISNKEDALEFGIKRNMSLNISGIEQQSNVYWMLNHPTLIYSPGLIKEKRETIRDNIEFTYTSKVLESVEDGLECKAPDNLVPMHFTTL